MRGLRLWLHSERGKIGDDPGRAVIAGGATFTPRDGGGHAVWQRRFWEHTIRDATDFARHVDYIHYFPCKHGYVAGP